jgi:hypothetical protein
LSDLREWPEGISVTILEKEQTQSTSQSSNGWSTGWSGWQDKWHGGYRKYRHVPYGAARTTVALVGLSLLQPGDAASTVAILAPSRGVLLLVVKVFMFSSTLKVANKVSEDADVLMDNAADTRQEAIAWTLKLYQWFGLFLSCFLLWGSFKWAKNIGLPRHLSGGDPSGSQDSAIRFAQYGDWLTESKVRSVARDPTGTADISSESSNTRLEPNGEGI